MVKKILAILYQPYKFIIFTPLLIISTLFFGSLTVILVRFIKPRTASFIGGTLWARLNSYLTPMFVTKIGRENIDPDQSYVIVSNHQSQYDIFVLYGWLGVDFKWVMKKELRKIPALGVACERLGHILIDRSNREAALKSLADAKNRIVHGTSVIFFPEGTRSLTGELGEFKKGAFVMAMELGLPILPVSIIGTRRILPPKSIRLLPGRVKLIINAPIDISNYSPEHIDRLVDDARAAVLKGMAS
jgi:1-acyl-sn-glycerol-3-phosphate acyltransferase